jgi:hypothetical protein
MSLQIRVYMALQVKVKVAEQAKDLTLLKYVCIRVYKKNLLSKLHLGKKVDCDGSGVRFQVLAYFKAVFKNLSVCLIGRISFS